MLPIPSSPIDLITFQYALDEAVVKCKEHHDTLFRYFPFLAAAAAAEISSDATNTEPNRAQAKATSSSRTKASPGGMGKLTTLAAGFGRMMKKQALTAVERVGAAGPNHM